MAHATARRDLKWLRPILRAHFKQYWRQVYAKLEAERPRVLSVRAKPAGRYRGTRRTDR